MFNTHPIQSVSRKDAFSENVPGPFYVNTQCIICSLCHELAPDVFRISEDETSFYVYAQPSTAEQLAAAEEALECCPMEAIVRDEND